MFSQKGFAGVQHKLTELFVASLCCQNLYRRKYEQSFALKTLFQFRCIYHLNLQVSTTKAIQSMSTILKQQSDMGVGGEAVEGAAK